MDLVINPKTLYVSPQLNYVFRITHMIAGIIPPKWAELVKKSLELVSSDKFDTASNFNP